MTEQSCSLARNISSRLLGAASRRAGSSLKAVTVLGLGCVADPDPDMVEGVVPMEIPEYKELLLGVVFLDMLVLVA